MLKLSLEAQARLCLECTSVYVMRQCMSAIPDKSMCPPLPRLWQFISSSNLAQSAPEQHLHAVPAWCLLSSELEAV